MVWAEKCEYPRSLQPKAKSNRVEQLVQFSFSQDSDFPYKTFGRKRLDLSGIEAALLFQTIFRSWLEVNHL